MRREGEAGVSVNWMEYFNGDAEAQIAQIQNSSSLKLSKNIGQTSRFFADKFALEFIYKPSYKDQSHSEITNLPAFGSDELYFAEILMTELIESSATIYRPAEA
jgi:hypothetical protein